MFYIVDSKHSVEERPFYMFSYFQGNSKKLKPLQITKTPCIEYSGIRQTISFKYSSKNFL